MKLYKITSLILFALACFTASAQPKAEWISTSHNYGIINENDGDAKCTFTLINTGDSPLVITNARATCGCTRPKYSKAAIAPGDSMTISVSSILLGAPVDLKRKSILTPILNLNAQHWKSLELLSHQRKP